MAMTKCRECGAEISSKATACPKCGNPMAKSARKRGCGTLFVYGIVGTIALMALMPFIGSDDGSSVTPTESKPKAPPASTAIDKSPEKQAGRLKLITELQSRGIVAKYECRDRAADVWVKPAFDALSFDDKQLFVSVFYTYCHEREQLGTFVRIRSHLTNKELGMFTAELGLRLE